jgi:hypothetical protein
MTDIAVSIEQNRVPIPVFTLNGTYKLLHLKLLKPSKNATNALRISGYDRFLEIYNERAAARVSF